MAKRIFSLLTTIVMVVGVIANANLAAFAETDYSKIIDVDIYKAQCFAGIANDEMSELVKRCNELYNYYINENIHSPTQSFLDAVYSDQALMDDYNEWKLYSLAADPSSALDVVAKKSDYYESLIIAMFSKASQNNSEWQKFLNNKIISGSNKMLNTLCKIANVGQISELVDKLDIKDSKTVGYVKQGVENYFPTGIASKVTGVIGDLLDTAKDVTDLVDRLSVYGSMVELDDSAKQWLEQMYNSCTSSTDPALTEALMSLKLSSTGFADATLAKIKEVSFSISNWAIKTAIDDGIAALASTNLFTMAVCTGLKAGKTICNIFFASSDICEQLFMMECIYDVQDLSRNVAENYKNTFIKSQTKNNALTFTYAVDCYYESIINVDIDCMEDFLDSLYNGGILKGLIKWVYGATDDYQDCVNTLEGLRNARIDNQALMIGYYKAALKANYPETFEFYFVKDDTVAITGLSFSISRIFPPGYPAGYADLLVGDFSNLDVQYEPSNTTQRSFNVISDNPDVIDVNGNVITAVSVGTAKVTVTSTENPRYFYTKEIKVGEKLNNTDDNTNNETLTSRFTYTINNNGATITGLVDGYNPTSLKIPSKIDGYLVTRIGDRAFQKNRKLTSVTIGNSVTIIGDWAFKDCTSLTNITIPDSVAGFGYDAFENCSSLTSITIPDSVTSFASGAFRSCTNLASITIPNSVTAIGWYAFEDCKSLSNVTIPDSVTFIGNYAFENCSSLTSITIPDSVTEIGQGAFNWCSSLTSITIPDSVTFIGNYAFENCSSLTSVIIENGVTSIGQWAFSDCKNLTSITIPNSVIVIDWNAFSGCDSLTNLIIPNSVTSIRGRAFSGCKSLVSITIPNSVTSIGDEVFWGCERLTSITIPDSVISIGFSAFYKCESLTIKCYKDSYAQQYAIENDIDYALLDAPNPTENSSDNPSDNPTQNPSNNPTSNSDNSSQNPTTAPIANSVTVLSNKTTSIATTPTKVAKPAKVTKLKATAKKKKLNVSWKKVSGATGYEVKVATNKKFTKGKKTVTVKKNKAVIKKLKSKKKYFVKVRAYAKVNGTKYYGKWSKVVKKKVK